MNAKITTFLNSGLLEKYLIGDTSVEENLHIENYITNYKEVEEQYNLLQNNLEILAKIEVIEAPKTSLSSILKELDDKPVIALKAQKSWYKYGIAVSVAALVFAFSAFILFTQNQKLTQENQVVVDELFDLRSDIDQNNKKLDKILLQFNKLNNPETQKFLIQGNNRAKNLKTVAYINAKEKTSMIDIVSLPKLPEEQCYQIWAELQGKMVSLGILSEEDRKLQSIPYFENIESINITIEPKGGNAIATLDNSVAELPL